MGRNPLLHRGIAQHHRVSRPDEAAAFGKLRKAQLQGHGPEPVSYTHLDVYKRQLEAPAVPLMVNTRISSTATTRFNMDTAPFVIASFAKKAGAAQPPLLFWALISVLIITHISTNCKFRYKSGGCFQHPVLFDNEIDQLVLYHEMCIRDRRRRSHMVWL